MADSSRVRTALDTLIAENWSSTVIDTLFDTMPALAIFLAKNGDGKRGPIGLGVPDAGIVLAGSKFAKSRKREILSSLSYQPMIHHLLPTEADGKTLTLTDNMPTRSAWESNSPAVRFKRPSFKWCEVSDPCKVPNEHIRHTRRTASGERNGWEAIGDLMRVESSDVLGIHLRRWNQLLWGTYAGAVATNGAPSDEDAEKWDGIHSFANALGSTNTYAGIDRTVAGNEFWIGGGGSGVVSAATPAVFRDLIRYANYTLGFAKKGIGIEVMLTGGTLFQVALNEAEAKGGMVVRAGEPIQEFASYGFKRDSVKIDNTWIIYDPEAPSGDVLGLNPSTWTVAIHPDANFRQSTPTDQSDNEGGDDARTWTIRTKLMVCCEVPWMNILWTNVS